MQTIADLIKIPYFNDDNEKCAIVDNNVENNDDNNDDDNDDNNDDDNDDDDDEKRAIVDNMLGFY